MIKPDKMIIDIKNELGWRERFSVNENGQFHGKYFAWHRNGNKLWEIDIVNGTSHGKYFLWDCDGRIVSELNYINGIKQGKGTNVRIKLLNKIKQFGKWVSKGI